MKILILFLTLTTLGSLSLTGCATLGKSIGAGGAIGAGTGALVGAIADPGKNGQYRTRNVFIGAAVGGMAGMATGALISDEIEDKKKEAYQDGQHSAQKLNNSQRPAGSPP